MATSVTLKPNAIDISGSTSGTTTLQASAVAGTTTLTLPAATDTLVGKATTDTLTNKTLTTPSVSSPTISDGTANGVAYLNGSKVLTTGSALVFDGSNLGLGVTPASHNSSVKALQIKNSSLISFGTDWNLMANSYYGSGGWTYTSSAAASGYQTASGAHYWLTAASGTAGNTFTFTQAMTLDSSGNLGIGTTTPNKTGFTSPVLSITNGTSGIVELIGNQTADATIGQVAFYNTSSSVRIAQILGLRSGANNSGAITFQTNNAGTLGEAARIDSSGNLLVGMTSTSGQSGVSIVPASATYTAIHHANGSASGAEYALFRYNGSGIGSITQNGTTGVLYNLTSDYRLKNDQQALTGAKDFIMALKPKKWQWWDGSGEGVGFVAHEFMEVAKHSGNGEKDAVDADGKPVYQSIQPSSSEVMANLVAFVQELKAEIDSLKSQLNGA